MSKYTPGPWKFRASGQFTEGEPGHEETHDYPAHVVVLDRTQEGLKRTRFIAECNGSGLPNNDNARLISMATELLEALKQAASMPIEDDEDGILDGWLEIIAKAEGPATAPASDAPEPAGGEQK